MVKATIFLNIKEERRKRLTKTKCDKGLEKISPLKSNNIDIEEVKTTIINSIKKAEETHCITRTNRDEKLSQKNKKLTDGRIKLNDKYGERLPRLR